MLPERRGNISGSVRECGEGAGVQVLPGVSDRDRARLEYSSPLLLLDNADIRSPRSAPPSPTDICVRKAGLVAMAFLSSALPCDPAEPSEGVASVCCRGDVVLM